MSFHKLSHDASDGSETSVCGVERGPMAGSLFDPASRRTVPETFVALRRQFHMTGKQLAHVLGISQQYVCDIEKGLRRLPDKRIAAILFDEMRIALVSARICEYEERIAVLKSSVPPGAESRSVDEVKVLRVHDQEHERGTPPCKSGENFP